MRFYVLSMGLACGICAAPALADNVITVGPGGQYQTISAAVAAADADANPGNYYIINVVPGTYTNDFPQVTRPMTIEIDPRHAGRKVVLKATEDLPNEKGIILTFAPLTVNGLTLTGAQIDNSLGGNGAGIRDENTGQQASLMVQNSTFSGNQDGILTDGDPGETITIINSSFKNNGNPNPIYSEGVEHGIYIGRAASLSVSNSLFCGQLIGHDIKSRAMVTTVENNSLYDGQADPAAGCGAGSASFAVDVPNGGVATISGNQIIQGTATQNDIMVAYGEEGLTYSNNSLLITSNDFQNTVANGIAIFDPDCIPADLENNDFTDLSTIMYPNPSCATGQ